MAIDNVTRFPGNDQPSVPPHPLNDGFRPLLRRLLIIRSQMHLVADNFGDLSGLTEDNVHAGIIAQESAKQLDALYDEIESWHERYTHIPRDAVGGAS